MIITQSVPIRDLIQLAERVAASSAPVLLCGESGTGKELFAQLIHDSSARASNRLVRVNCAALSGSLVESELFGHERGAFTDAVSNRVGRFELAQGGSLLLDEISEIPVTTQAKLLRVLETGEYERVGSSESLQQDVRVIASSNRDLGIEVESGKFRLDLYHRINVVQIDIPPLRERREDIAVLAMHFVRSFAAESRVAVQGFTEAALRTLAAHPWPGNVRELRNVVHRACILTDNELIDSPFLRLRKPSARRPSQGTQQPVPEHWLNSPLAEAEREIILAAIDKFGNRNTVAQKLGVSPRTLTNKVRQYRDTNPPRRDAA